MSRCGDPNCDSPNSTYHCEVRNKTGHWVCTRPKGHLGPHIACNSREHNLETWGEGAPGFKPKYFRQLLAGVK